MDQGVRTSVLLWSTISGFIGGVVVGALLFGAAALVSIVLPDGWQPLVGRLRLPVVLLCLVAVPLGAALLGFLEGRAKLS